MKKNIINSVFGLAVASLMLTACSSTDEVATAPAATTPEASETPINFGAYMNRTTTRGGYEGELTLDALKAADTGFGVMSYYTDNQPYTPNATPNFMYNQQVTYDTDHWKYSPLKYWPNEFGEEAVSTGLDRLSFFAYAPYVAVDPVTGYALPEEDPITGDPIVKDYGIVGMTRSAENGNPKVRYYVNLDPSKQVDLCWATPWLDYSKQPADPNIKFEFSHALSSLNVQVDAKFDNGGTLDPNTRIWVRSVTFEGLALKGELNLNNFGTDPEWNDLYSNGLLIGEPVTIYDGRRDGREGYAEMPNEKPIAINAKLVQSEPYEHNGTAFTKPDPDQQPGVTTTAVNLFEGAANATDPVYVIPTGQQLRINIVYDVETYDASLTSSYLSDTESHGISVENNITKVVELAANSPITLKAGKKYTVQLHLGMTSVKLDVKEEDFGWVAGDTGNTDLPANN